jgi:hypothetical protein
MKATSLFDRLIGRRRPVWLTLLVSLVLLSLPFLSVYLDGGLGEVTRRGEWRVLLLPPVIIIYILLVTPMMMRMSERVLEALRQLVPLEDAEFQHLVEHSARLSPLSELVLVAVGFALGILSALASGIDDQYTWLRVYWFLCNGLMYALLAWTIYVSIASTRVNAAIHRQELRFDILDQRPFDAVGRQSLLLALVFIGGITLSLLLSFQPGSLAALDFWIGYLVLMAVVILIFFLNMLPTHRLLVAEKNRSLAPVGEHINRLSRQLVRRLDLGQDTGELPGQISALTLYEARLRTARTWPYNTAMLRTLFFSVLIPIGTLLIRLIFELLYG